MSLFAGRQQAALWACFGLGAVLAGLADRPEAPRRAAPFRAALDPHFSASEAREPGPPARVPLIERAIVSAAERHGLDPALVQALITAESGHRSDAVSEKGAVGLMQILPETAALMGYPAAADPGTNLEAGCAYLAQLMTMFGGDAELALAGYNAGPGMVRQWGTVPPFRETRAFVAKVKGEYQRLTGNSLDASSALNREP